MIRDAFARNTSDLAELFGVPKKVIYQWIEGSSAVPVKQRQRVGTVRAFAEYWNALDAGRMQSLRGESDDSSVLLHLLSAPEMDEVKIYAELERLAQCLSERTKTRGVPSAADLQARHRGATLPESHYRRNIRMASLDARLLVYASASFKREVKG